MGQLQQSDHEREHLVPGARPGTVEVTRDGASDAWQRLSDMDEPRVLVGLPTTPEPRVIAIHLAAAGIPAGRLDDGPRSSAQIQTSVQAGGMTSDRIRSSVAASPHRRAGGIEVAEAAPAADAPEARLGVGGVTQAGRRRPARAPAPAGRSVADRPEQLRLVHARAPLDALPLGLGVQLASGAATRAAVRPQAATTAGRDVIRRGPAGLACLASAGTLLVDRACRDLLRLVLALAAVEKALP